MAQATHITYEVVQHNGGWAYKVGDVFSETFPDHERAREAAETAAKEHQLAGRDENIVNTRTSTAAGARSTPTATTARRRMWRGRTAASYSKGLSRSGQGDSKMMGFENRSGVDFGSMSTGSAESPHLQAGLA